MTTEPLRIAIHGLAGRFPQSGSVSEFYDNLMSGTDMVQETTRWPAGIHGIPSRTGNIKDIEEIDPTLFGIHGAQAEKMDSQLRLLLHSTLEALNDASLSPEVLRGSNTGVFIGACFSDMHDYVLRDPEAVTGYEQTGCAQSMFANRLSFTFDWHGPSYTVDTACSSSMVALSCALKSLESGDCDIAIVGGSSITLRPEGNLAFNKLHMLSPDGACKSFDVAANGYCRYVLLLINDNDTSYLFSSSM